ncbi:hypothetical protein OAG24_00925 [bacterium]|nr:hypothetical protein [bacterium]
MDSCPRICAPLIVGSILIVLIVGASLQIEIKNRIDGWPSGLLIINNNTIVEKTGGKNPESKIFADCIVDGENCTCVALYPYGDNFLFRPVDEPVNEAIHKTISKNETQMKWDPNFDCSETIECVVQFPDIGGWIAMLVSSLAILLLSVAWVVYSIFFKSD